MPALVTTPAVACEVMYDATVAGEAPGEVDRYFAAAPATCGVAIDVPLIVFVAVVDVADIQAEVIDEPGANRSMQVPMLE